MKRVIGAVVALGLMLNVGSGVSFAGENIGCIKENAGDANGDLKVNAKDVSFLLRRLADGEKGYIDCADVNRDGAVSAKDVSRIMKHLSGTEGIYPGHVSVKVTESGTGDCTGEGRRTVKCSGCATVFEDTVIPAKGHIFKNYVCTGCRQSAADIFEKWAGEKRTFDVSGMFGSSSSALTVITDPSSIEDMSDEEAMEFLSGLLIGSKASQMSVCTVKGAERYFTVTLKADKTEIRLKIPDLAQSREIEVDVNNIYGEQKSFLIDLSATSYLLKKLSGTTTDEYRVVETFDIDEFSKEYSGLGSGNFDCAGTRRYYSEKGNEIDASSLNSTTVSVLDLIVGLYAVPIVNVLDRLMADNGAGISVADLGFSLRK